ncbi:MAG: hypothetical protein ABIO44_09795 [Saprospiraceae bacterium]
MEDKATLIESLFEKAEGYAKTNFDLFKLKAIDKSADVVSTIVAKIAIIIVVLIIVFLLNIGLALWIGELLGKNYYGFFIVAAFYVLVALILNYNRGIILKEPVNNSIILQMIKEKK